MNEDTHLFESTDLEDSPLKEDAQPKRMIWLDQLRGFCILLYTIAVIAYALSKDVQLGEYPLYPTYLNHGWAISFSIFGDVPANVPVPITFVDLGQGVLMFLVGMMQSYSFRRRKKEINNQNAWIHSLNRFTVLLGISVILEDIMFGYGIYIAVFDGVFAIIAWATLFSAIATAIVKKSHYRILCGSILLVLHYILYSIPSIRNWNIFSESIWYFTVPWRMINISAIAIIASGISFYLFSKDGSVNEQNFTKIILPTAIGCFGLSFLLDFFQFANPVVFNTPLALLALGVALVAIFLFYSFEKVNFKIPGLSELGCNMFFFFMFSPIFEWILAGLLEPYLSSLPILSFFVFMVVPLGVTFLIAFLLERKRIIWKI